MNSFGRVAIRLGFITQTQLDEAMKVQAASAKAGLRKRLGEILIKKGYLTTEQFQKVLKGQTLGKKRIGDYELLSKLGEGGMGAVFKARQVFADRIIALKILSPKMAKNKEFQNRFVREAQAVAKLNHPHIVSGIDVGAADGYCYFAMEFVDGESLGQYMHRKGGKLDEAVALDFIRQMALALQHAHENKLLHRDVKPDNILLDKNCSTAKLADLGLARSSENADEDAALTQAGQAVGTPFYISPEQARGKTDLTPATDLYSLGATLFHLLTGQVPFDGATAALIMTRHLTDPVPSLRTIRPSITPGAEKIVLRLMEKEPEDRYPNAKALIADIERVLEGDTLDGEKKGKGKASRTPAPPSAPVEREEFSGGTSHTRGIRRRRRRQEVGMGGALVVFAVLAIVLMIMQPWKTLGRNKKKPAPAPQAGQRPREKPKAVVAPPSDPPPPPAVAAVLQTGADGSKTYKADFEGALENFDVDPLVGRAGHYLKPISDAAGTNKVLRLAQIRPSTFHAKDSGVMARLLLPPDAALSNRTRLSFMVHFENYADPNPEVKVWWDHKVDANVRAVAGWSFKDAAFKTGWGRIQVQLGKAPMMLPSKEEPGAPQYISIMAGKADEALEVFIDDLEIIDAEESAPDRPVAPRPKKRPAPADPAEQPEPPVAPPPAEKKAPDAADALRNAL